MTHLRLYVLAAFVLLATAACADAPDPQAPQSAVPSSTGVVQAPTASADVIALAPTVAPSVDDSSSAVALSEPATKAPDVAPVPAPTSDAPPPTALTAVEVPAKPLPAGPLAPEIQNEVWLNSPRLTAADLRGHPVLVEFWTFG